MTEDLVADDPDLDALVLPDGWTEASFATDTAAGHGFAATLERDTASLEVLPVSYERDGHRERLSPLAADDPRSFERRGPPAVDGDVPRTEAFALVASCRPATRDRTDVVCVAADAGDALAAAVWLARGSSTDRELERTLRLHRGEQTTATDVAVSDDDALGALFRDDPDRCLFTGTPTRSHHVVLPYRYLPTLEHAKTTRRGVIRVPSTVRALVGAVSHRAWTERDLGAVAFDAPLERDESGVYRLDGDVLSAVAGRDAADFALCRLGEALPG
ncbi:MAG: hypothetical protein ABEJ42_00970 [Halobacteriaceae archaeon]